MSKYTYEQERWLKMREASKNLDYITAKAFVNCALLNDGTMACGLTNNTVQKCYSATYVKKNGEIIDHGVRWDYTGANLDNVGDEKNLNMKTVNKNMRVI